MKPSEDKPDFEKVIDAYLINWDNDGKTRREMAIDLLTQEVEPLRLKLKEKEIELSNYAYQIDRAKRDRDTAEALSSKLEQSNNNLKEMLYECIGYFEHNYASTVKIKEIKQLIQSEGTTKKE